jgi:hypothetical protein
VNADAITALQAICKDLCGFAVNFDGVELAGPFFSLFHVVIFVINNGKISNLVSIVKRFYADRRRAFFADHFPDN